MRKAKAQASMVDTWKLSSLNNSYNAYEKGLPTQAGFKKKGLQPPNPPLSYEISIGECPTCNISLLTWLLIQSEPTIALLASSIVNLRIKGLARIGW